MFLVIFTVGFYRIYFFKNTDGDVNWALILIGTFTLPLFTKNFTKPQYQPPEN